MGKLDSVHKTGPETSKTSESELRLSLGERWKITEIRRQLNDTEVEVASIGYLSRPRSGEVNNHY